MSPKHTPETQDWPSAEDLPADRPVVERTAFLETDETGRQTLTIPLTADEEPSLVALQWPDGSRASWAPSGLRYEGTP